MATKKKAEEKTSALALAQHDELADLGLDDEELGTDGLEETDSSDQRIAALVFNFKGTDDAGDPVPANAFFDTVTEEVKKSARLALLTIHKSNAWTEYDQAEGRTRVRCRSWDRVAGETDEGTTRSCDGCPDKQWQRNPETGKRTRHCADIHNIVGLDLDDGQPKILRCKKTSERPWKDYLNKHFLGKRIGKNGKRRNLPIFAVETNVSLEMVKGGAAPYAVPKFERGSVFSKDEIKFFAESSKGFRELYLEDVRAVAEGADAKEVDETTGSDASFDPSEFADDNGAGAAAGNGARF